MDNIHNNDVFNSYPFELLFSVFVSETFRWLTKGARTGTFVPTRNTMLKGISQAAFRNLS